MTVLADGVPEGTQTGNSSAVVLTDPTVNMKNLSDFYILEGRTYEKVTGLLMALLRRRQALQALIIFALISRSSATTSITSKLTIRTPTS